MTDRGSAKIRIIVTPSVGRIRTRDDITPSIALDTTCKPLAKACGRIVVGQVSLARVWHARPQRPVRPSFAVASRLIAHKGMHLGSPVGRPQQTHVTNRLVEGLREDAVAIVNKELALVI